MSTSDEGEHERESSHKLLGEHGQDVGKGLNESDLDSSSEVRVPLRDPDGTSALSLLQNEVSL